MVCDAAVELDRNIRSRSKGSGSLYFNERILAAIDFGGLSFPRTLLSVRRAIQSCDELTSHNHSNTLKYACETA
jgi:hypothetical protein